MRSCSTYQLKNTDIVMDHKIYIAISLPCAKGSRNVIEKLADTYPGQHQILQAVKAVERPVAFSVCNSASNGFLPKILHAGPISRQSRGWLQYNNLLFDESLRVAESIEANAATFILLQARMEYPALTDRKCRCESSCQKSTSCLAGSSNPQIMNDWQAAENKTSRSDSGTPGDLRIATCRSAKQRHWLLFSSCLSQ